MHLPLSTAQGTDIPFRWVQAFDVSIDRILFTNSVGGTYTHTITKNGQPFVNVTQSSGLLRDEYYTTPLTIATNDVMIADSTGGAGTDVQFQIFGTRPGSTTPTTPITPNSATNVSATRTSAGVISVSWSAPSSGITPTGYRIDYDTTNLNQWIQGPTLNALTTTFSNLTIGSTYRFSVVALNGSESAPRSTASGSVAFITNPSAPSGLTSVFPGNASVQLNISPISGGNGGSSITGYSVLSRVSNSGNSFASTNVTLVSTGQHTVTGLTNGVSYDLVAVASNGFYTSLPSSVTIAIPQSSTGNPPQAPSFIGIDSEPYALEDGQGSVVIGGRDPLATSFDLRWRYNLLNSSFTTISGLTPAQAANYSFSVSPLDVGSGIIFGARAINANGQSDWFDESSAISNTNALAPSAPTGLSRTVSGTNEVTLSYGTPTNTGGSAVLGYIIEYTTNGFEYTEITRSATGIQYAHSSAPSGMVGYRIAARNATGGGSYAFYLNVSVP